MGIESNGCIAIHLWLDAKQLNNTTDNVAYNGTLLNEKSQLTDYVVLQHKGLPYCEYPCYLALFGPRGYRQGLASNSSESRSGTDFELDMAKPAVSSK